MQVQTQPDIAKALALHRQGSIAEAKTVYQRIIAADPADANVIGLLGIVAIQEGDRATAESLWKASISLDSDAFVFIRNLNNLVTTLLEDLRETEARALLDAVEIPNWASLGRPDEREIKSIASLGMCLQGLNLIKKARALLEPVAAILPEDKEAMRFLAALRFEDKGFQAALEILKTFTDPNDIWVLTTRLKCEAELGLKAEAAVDHEKILKVGSVHVGDRSRRDLKSVLVINASDRLSSTDSLFDLHFTGNFPSQMALSMKDLFNFSSIFWDSPYAKSVELKPDLVLNNIVNAELLRTGSKTTDDLSALAESFGVPIINHPAKAALTTRQKVTAALKDLPNLVVPKIMRFKVDIANLLFQVTTLEQAMKYPMIVRSTKGHRGAGMARVSNRPELEQEFHARDGVEIYVNEYIENRMRDGLYRKFRATYVGDTIIPTRVDFSESWMVHGRRTPDRKQFYRQRRDLLKLEAEMLEPSSGALNDQVMETLAEVRKHIPLDIFGIDFDILPDGKVLFFEANASMNLFGLPSPDEQDIQYPLHAEKLMHEKVADFIRQRIGG